MESVGLLAGGIAHNFNNMLAAILGYVELILDDDTLDNTIRHRLRNIEGAARKAGDLVSKLLSFARRDRHEILTLNLNDVIQDSIKLLRGMLDKRIEIREELSQETPVIEGDPTQLEQILMNLIVNARDAVSADGGVITIKTEMTEVKRSTADMPAYIQPGTYVLLTVSDTGTGIPKEAINRIFEPFFTTKERGRGTGLGLAMVYGIIKDHKGYITVKSELAKGTTFRIYLPLSGKKPFYEALRKQPPLSASFVSGQEHVLVVDDDEDVLNFIKDILESRGYQVLAFHDPLGALDMFKSLSNEIELIIIDIVMPVMNGKELIRNLKTIKPDIKVIAISGYSDEPVNKENMMIDAFVKKPFEGHLLLSTVRKILDAVKLK
jgi:CheY-like chemotaxis protein/two-component sensor histidine kinase